MNMNEQLPEFDNPPVIEVALSVQFERLSLSAAHLGLVWEKFRGRFPVIQEMPELEAALERFDPPEKGVPGVRVEVGSMPIPRFWFINEAGSELVQVQRDRFIRNWRKTEGQPNYPRYDNLRTAFDSDWEIFASFASQESNAQLVPNQCEVTYVNIIEDADTGQLERVIQWVNGSYSDDYLDNPEDAELKLRYVLKDEDEKPWGRLHIAVARAIRPTDSKPVVRLSLTARGEPRTRDHRGSAGVAGQGA